MSQTVRDRENREWLLSMAYLYLQQAHYKKALVLLQVTEKLYQKANENDAGVTRALIFVYLKIARYKEALTLCDRNLKKLGINPGTAPFLLLRSHALWALERQDEARKSLKKYYQLTGSPAK